MSSDVVLTIGGERYGGWTALAITRGMEQIAGSFNLTLTERWPGQETVRGVRAGDACQVSIGGQTVITGYVDNAEPSHDDVSHSITVSGRDKTGDLVDCSAIHQSGAWHDVDLKTIASDLCEPFDINVTDDAGASEKFEDFSIQEGETVFETLERAARIRGVLLTSSSDGDLVMTQAGNDQSGSALRLGENVKSGSARFSAQDRFSEYIGKGSKPGSDDVSGSQVSAPTGSAKDSGVNRYRPMIVIAEDNVSAADVKRRAEWEASVRAGRALRAEVTVQGWSNESGQLWEPNQLVRLDHEWLGLNREMLVSSVNYTLDEGGTLCTLSLALPDAFASEPFSGMGGESMWTS